MTRLSYAARTLLNALVTTHPSGMGTATVYTERALRRNLGIYRELEAHGKIRIGFERDVTTPNMKHRKSFITFTIITEG